MISRLSVAVLAASLANACGDSETQRGQITLDAALDLEAYETRDVLIHYRDSRDVALRDELLLTLEGDVGGARLQAKRVTPDLTGVARVTLTAGVESQFSLWVTTIRADAVRVPVSVTEARGTIEVRVSHPKPANIDRVDLVLGVGQSCTAFDPLQPTLLERAGIADAVPETTQRAASVAIAAPAEFSELRTSGRYRLTAIARREGTAVASACRDGIGFGVGEQAASRMRVDLVLQDLFDREVFALDTRLNQPLRFVRLAGLATELSDAERDPLEYVLGRALPDEMLPAPATTASKAELIADLFDGDIQHLTLRQELRHLSERLVSSKIALLHSRLTIVSGQAPFANDPDRVLQQWQATHALTGITMEGTQGSIRHDAAEASPPTDPALLALTLRDGGELTYAAHRVTRLLPLAARATSASEFGTLLGRLDCSALASQTTRWFQREQRVDPDHADHLYLDVAQRCQTVIAELVERQNHAIEHDMAEIGARGSLGLGGASRILLHQDRRRIASIRHGRWTGFGTFIGQRQ